MNIGDVQKQFLNRHEVVDIGQLSQAARNWLALRVKDGSVIRDVSYAYPQPKTSYRVARNST
jgi:hypothetical protein